MNKRQVISSLNKIAEELDNNGLYVEAKQVSGVMKKIAQMEATQPDTRQNVLKMLDINLNFISNDIKTGNPINQNHIETVNKVKRDINALSNILPLYLGKTI
jgi:putative NIF3 family GTP cyclohydrolase 1 type 2